MGTFYLVTLFNAPGCALAQEICEGIEAAREHVRFLSNDLEPGDTIDISECTKHGEVL